MIRLCRWIGWWLHRILVYPDYQEVDKLAILRGQIQSRKNDAFQESAYASKFRKVILDGNMSAYDVCLRLIEKLGGKSD